MTSAPAITRNTDNGLLRYLDGAGVDAFLVLGGRGSSSGPRWCGERRFRSTRNVCDITRDPAWLVRCSPR
jgi:hypothetical protein